jgi:hypothetical protein
VAGRPPCVAHAMPRIRGNGGVNDPRTARGSDRSGLGPRVGDADTGSPAGSRVAAAAGTSAGDVGLLCSGDALYCVHLGPAVVRVCVDGPAGTTFGAGLGDVLCHVLSHAGNSDGDPPAFPGNPPGGSRRLAPGMNGEPKSGRFVMVIRDDTSTRFRDEIRLISRWAWLAAAVGFLTLVGLAAFSEFGCRMSTTSWASGSGLNWTCTPFTSAPADAVQPPKAIMVLLGLFAGSLVACLPHPADRLR